MTPVRLALVGYGRWGRNYVRAARESGEAEVTVVINRSEVDAETRAAHPGIRFGGQNFFLSAIKNCDAVIYAGHPGRSAHVVEIVLRCQGKPVMVEKPAGLSGADAEVIANAEAATKSFVLVNHQHLFAKGYEALRQHLAANGYGAAHAYWKGPGPTRDYSARWDYGAHAAAALIGLNPAAHWRLSGPTAWSGDDDAAECDLWFGTALARIEVSRVAETKDARVFVDMGNGMTVGYDGHAPAEPPLTRSVRAFAKAVRAGGTDDWRFGARWAVDVASVLESTAL